MKVKQEVVYALQNAKVQGNKAILTQQFSRPLYQEVNRVLMCLGGEWNRKAQAHVFSEGDVEDLIADVVATGQVTDAKKEFQFFETPIELARRMVKLADIKPDDRILEPSAGKGGILEAIFEAAPEAIVDACELEPNNREYLKARYGESLNLVHENFLHMPGEPLFSRIVANPPFSRGQDVEHVRHMHSLLMPGGRMVAITAPGWTFRNDCRHSQFRDWVEEVGAQKTELPEGTFAESGTPIRTIMLVINK